MPTPCPSPDGSSERQTKFAEAPPFCIDLAKTYTATMSTSMTAGTDTEDPPTTTEPEEGSTASCPGTTAGCPGTTAGCPGATTSGCPGTTAGCPGTTGAG